MKLVKSIGAGLYVCPGQLIVCLVGFIVGINIGASAFASGIPNVGLYRVFEIQIQNDKPYDNKFADVDLTVTYTSPSGKTVDFWGFFDGDGRGGFRLCGVCSVRTYIRCPRG